MSLQWDIHQVPNLDGKRVLITGANSGIGFEAAGILAGKGAEVVLACRSEDKGKAAMAALQQSYPGARLQFMQLDLASLESIATFADAFSKQYSTLDILINNAGVMAPPLGRTADGFEMQFGTNHLGHFALTGRLLPLLEAAGQGRVVVVSSLAHRVGRINFNNLNAEQRYLRWPAYGQSKLANLLFAKELQRRLASKGSTVKAVAVHPGYSSTNLQRHTPGGALMNKIAQTQQQGCLPTVCGATSTQLKGGEYLGPDGWMEVKGHPKLAYEAKVARDKAVAKKLWEVSEELTSVRFLSAA